MTDPMPESTDEQTVESLIAAVLRCEATQFRPAACRRNAERFSLDRFRRELMNFVETTYVEHREN